MTWRQEGYLNLGFDCVAAIVFGALGFWIAAVFVAFIAGAIGGILLWTAR